MLKIYFTEQTYSVGNIIIGMVEDQVFWVSINDNGSRFKQYIAYLEKTITTQPLNKNPEKFAVNNPIILRMLKSRSISVIKDDNPFSEIMKLINAYFNREKVEFSSISTIYLSGTTFTHKVWNALKSVPWGETRSYKDISKIINSPNSFRAVGNANGSNLIPLIIPCHRIIKSDGGLGGYSCGLDIKKKLLKIESISFE